MIQLKSSGRRREVEFIQKEDAERRRLEEAEKAHLAEIQELQVRVKPSRWPHPPLSPDLPG